MQRPSNALLLATLLACTSPASAQSDQKPDDRPADVCATELTREKLDNPPERKTMFEVMEEPLKLRLHDVKAVEEKFLALVWIELPADQQGNPGGRTVDGLRSEGKINDLQLFRSRYWLAPTRGRAGTDRDGAELAFTRMLEFIPEKRRPTQEEVRFFTSVDVNRVLLDDRSRSETYRGLRILAESPEEAQRRVEVLLAFLDQGLTRPIQLALFDQRTEHCQAIEKRKPEVPANREMARAISKELQQYAEFTAEMLPELRVQQLQLEVELAGVKARLKTCDRLLAGAISEERRKQVEDVKIAAEIELAGFEARQAKLGEFVAKLKTKQELSAKHTEAAGKASLAEYQIRESEKSVAAIDREIAAFGPVKLDDDRVAIHPIEWTQ